MLDLKNLHYLFYNHYPSIFYDVFLEFHYPLWPTLKIIIVSLIDDFTVENVRTITICETVSSTRDDIENDIAYNENSDTEDIINPNLEITGNKVILLGDTLEYKLPIANSWELEYGQNALTFVSIERGKCVVKCSSDSKYIGDVVTLTAIDRIGNTIDEIEIRIGGMF